MARSLQDAEPDEDFFAGFDRQSFRLPRPGLIDREAVAWAVGKLRHFRLHEAGGNNPEMLERLTAMLQ